MEPQIPPAPSAPLLTTSLKGPIELLRESWSTYKHSWKVLTGISLVPPVIIGVGILLTLLENIGTTILGVILVVIAVILYIAMQGAIVDAVRKVDAYPRETITIKGQYRFGFTLFWSFILLAIIQFFVSAGSIVLFVIPGIIISIYTLFYLYAFVIDGKKGFSALVESYTVVKNRWWKTVGRVLMLVLLYLVATLASRGLGYLIAMLFGLPPQTDGYEAIMSVLSQIAGIVVGPFAVLYMYKLYQSLKETRTGAANAATFKKWLVTFIVIGIVVVPLLFVAAFLSGFNAAREKAEEARQQAELRLQTPDSTNN